MLILALMVFKCWIAAGKKSRGLAARGCPMLRTNQLQADLNSTALFNSSHLTAYPFVTRITSESLKLRRKADPQTLAARCT